MEEVRPGFLLKYMERRFVSDFINKGRLHFSALGDFIDLENSTGDNTIGDKAEGMRTVSPDPEHITLTFTVNGKEYAFQGKKDGITGINYSYTDDVVRRWGVVSICNMDIFRDCDEVSSDDPTGISTFKLKKSVLEDLYRLSDDGKRVPVIIDAKGLMDVMENKFSDGKLNIKLQNVKYYSSDVKENIALEDYKKSPENIIFLKRDLYSYQRESRIALLEPVPDKKGRNIDIGSLKDAAFDMGSHDKLKDLTFRMKIQK